jgi:hypothetical protein
MHQLTGGMTVLLSGSVLFDLAKPGETASWLLALAATAAVLSAWDIAVGYAACAAHHHGLRGRFAALEIAILNGDSNAASWAAYQRERLLIEQDEPPVYRALDLLCHNELLVAEAGRRDGDNAEHLWTVSTWQRMTRHLLHWGDIATH